ncbi:hypothetical protein MHBO_001201 [Bonamia ostreae]|uniref:Uncharacterized protein n=1 Tax=Bonamia ostreae TaxID=126728 RepID=A0ABV2AI45_9EUKA
MGGLRFVVIKDAQNLYRETDFVQNNEMIKISKHSKVPKIAKLFIHYLLKTGSLTMGSMGSTSVFQGIKSIILAGKQLQKMGLEISFQPRFVSLQIGDAGNEKRSVLKIEVKIEKSYCHRN